MIRPAVVANAAGERSLAVLPSPLHLAELVAGEGAWELEIGFGKGRYLVSRATAEPMRRFLGIEVAGEYYREVARRIARRRLANLAVLRGEAQYLLATALPPSFAAAVHVYFPDPWPKAHHHRRRLFSPGSLDLVLRPLVAGGDLFFATDHLDYGAEVEAVLAGQPGLELERIDGEWPEGARTHYEAKYIAEGRPILRLHGVLRDAARLHPAGRSQVLIAHPPIGAPLLTEAAAESPAAL